jgi:hypothetical protein
MTFSAEACPGSMTAPRARIMVKNLARYFIGLKLLG